MAVITLLTAEDLFRLPSDLRCELIDGVVVEMPPAGILHARTAGRFSSLLAGAEKDGLGCLLGEGGFVVRRNPDTVRAPDVAFIRKEHVPADGFPRGYWPGAPDLAVEVVSPNDTAAEIQTKVREWIEAGAGLVLVAYPETRAVEAIRSLRERVRLVVGDVVDCDPAIPGFSIQVADIFA